MNRLWPLLLPELQEFPTSEQDTALSTARATPLDVLELMSMAAGLVAVTALTRYALPVDTAATRLGYAVWNFVVAVPLLVLALGPFHIRRLRRGLRKQLQDRRQP